MPRARILLVLAFGLVGLIWLGQGLGIIPGSFMTDSTFWAVMGGVLLAAAGVMAWSVYRSGRQR